MRKVQFFIVISLLTLLQGCTTNNVTSDYNPEYDFTALKSFLLLPSKQSLETETVVSQLNLDRIQTAIQQQLETRYSAVKSTSQADFLVRYHVILKDKVDIHTYDNFYGGYRGYGHYAQTVDVRHYTQGTLIIDVLDAKTSKHIWRGNTHSRVNKKLSPEEKTARLNQAVSDILTGFPPVHAP